MKWLDIVAGAYAIIFGLFALGVGALIPVLNVISIPALNWIPELGIVVAAGLTVGAIILALVAGIIGAELLGKKKLIPMQEPIVKIGTIVLVVITLPTIVLSVPWIYAMLRQIDLIKG